MLRLLAGLGVLGLAACAHPAAEKTARTASALALSSAIVAPSQTVTGASTLVLACHGEAFCREDIVGTSDDDARTDVSDDCARHRGSLSQVPCARERALATCSLGGEHGPIRVFAYPQSDPNDLLGAVGTMKDLCEQMSGELVLAD